MRVSLEAALSHPPKVALDLSNVLSVDSSGLIGLIGCLRFVQASGGEIRLFGLRQPARVIFEQTRMHRVFEIFNTAQETIASYRR